MIAQDMGLLPDFEETLRKTPGVMDIATTDSGTGVGRISKVGSFGIFGDRFWETIRRRCLTPRFQHVAKDARGSH